jgi:hypothetical protein
VLEHIAFSSTGAAGPYVVYTDKVEQVCDVYLGELTDLDRDGDVDLGDFAEFQACFNGPNRPAAQGCSVDSDFDDDADADLTDFATFQACFNGPNRPPQCP